MSKRTSKVTYFFPPAAYENPGQNPAHNISFWISFQINCQIIRTHQHSACVFRTTGTDITFQSFISFKPPSSCSAFLLLIPAVTEVGHSWTGRQFITDPHRQTHTLTHGQFRANHLIHAVVENMQSLTQELSCWWQVTGESSSRAPAPGPDDTEATVESCSSTLILYSSELLKANFISNNYGWQKWVLAHNQLNLTFD